jgi:hypothetical protein
MADSGNWFEFPLQAAAVTQEAVYKLPVLQVTKCELLGEYNYHNDAAHYMVDTAGHMPLASCTTDYVFDL